ncbi:hypothetical protein M0813_29267 [Anaeramoeba flamelloides]|uniref:Uncharacterized protein n=1 Tax=Anaeramoeba flamelloides TaxID=1746091 RepID=A0ABQ8XTH5_9EUKA|nr:hypothetical protein M0813_29267 [Anaeramoeba flamelloides]
MATSVTEHKEIFVQFYKTIKPYKNRNPIIVHVYNNLLKCNHLLLHYFIERKEMNPFTPHLVWRQKENKTNNELECLKAKLNELKENLGSISNLQNEDQLFTILETTNQQIEEFCNLIFEYKKNVFKFRFEKYLKRFQESNQTFGNLDPMYMYYLLPNFKKNNQREAIDKCLQFIIKSLNAQNVCFYFNILNNNGEYETNEKLTQDILKMFQKYDQYLRINDLFYNYSKSSIFNLLDILVKRCSFVLNKNLIERIAEWVNYKLVHHSNYDSLDADLKLQIRLELAREPLQLFDLEILSIEKLGMLLKEKLWDPKQILKLMFKRLKNARNNKLLLI